MQGTPIPIHQEHAPLDDQAWLAWVSSFPSDPSRQTSSTLSPLRQSSQGSISSSTGAIASPSSQTDWSFLDRPYARQNQHAAIEPHPARQASTATRPSFDFDAYFPAADPLPHLNPSSNTQQSSYTSHLPVQTQPQPQAFNSPHHQHQVNPLPPPFAASDPSPHAAQLPLTNDTSIDPAPFLPPQFQHLGNPSFDFLFPSATPSPNEAFSDPTQPTPSSAFPPAPIAYAIDPFASTSFSPTFPPTQQSLPNPFPFTFSSPNDLPATHDLPPPPRPSPSRRSRSSASIPTHLSQPSPWKTTSASPNTSRPRPSTQARRKSSAAAATAAALALSEAVAAEVEAHAEGSRSSGGGGGSGSSPAMSATSGGDEDSEDKRRRNTEASARFRAKKKAKSINLERSVTDLQGRIGDLEVEREELKKENGWLKGIVTSQVQRRNGRGVDG